MDSLPSLPNPLTPLAWLTPDVARQVEITRYLLAAVAGAWIWDLLITIPDMVRMYSVSPFKAPDIAQIASRTGAGSLILTTLVLTVASVDDCNALAKAVGWLGVIILPLHTVPFFFCARAVFNSHRKVLAVFAVLWVATLAGSLVSPFFIHGERIGATNKCIPNLGTAYSAGIVSVAANNTITFFSISFHLALYTQAETWAGRFKALVRTRGAGETSKLLMESGQQFVIPIVICNDIAAIVNLIPSVADSYRLLLVVASVAFQSAMTARIHRHIKMGFINAHPTSTPNTAMNRTVEFRRPSDSRFTGSYPAPSHRGTVTILSETIDFGPAAAVSVSSSGSAEEKGLELAAIAEENSSYITASPVDSKHETV